MKPITFGSVCSGIEAASVACKACSNCNITKPLADFHKSAKAADGHASWCKVCANSMSRTSRRRTYDADSKRRWQLNTRYRLTPADVETLFSRQRGVCALCPVLLGKFHIDHDHNTGVVRGLLCHRCNIRLGGWDDLEWRQRAMQYIGIQP